MCRNGGSSALDRAKEVRCDGPEAIKAPNAADWGLHCDGIAKPGSFTGRQARIRLRSGLPALSRST
eukprot:scaffold4847_cov89-Cylindrotheca_fusiformis.AAC.8